MKTLLGKAAIAAVLAASTLVFASPAAARHGDDDAAIAIGAGLIGLAIGAAIASDRDDDRYYERRHHYDSYPRYRTYYRYDSYPRYYRHDYRDRRHYDRRRDWRRDDWRRDDRRWRDRDDRRRYRH